MIRNIVTLLMMGMCFSNFADAKIKTSWGGKITLTNEVTLANAVKNETLVKNGTEFLLTGRVEKVCIKKGCWMIIKDGPVETRVKFKDYAFFVDETLLGKKILAQGVLKRKTVSKAEVEHYLVDEGMDPKEAAKVAKEKKTFTFIASGVKI